MTQIAWTRQEYKTLVQIAKNLEGLRIAARDIADAMMANSSSPKCNTVCVSAFGEECGCTVVAACDGTPPPPTT